jgi:hypothetical protein
MLSICYTVLIVFVPSIRLVEVGATDLSGTAAMEIKPRSSSLKCGCRRMG